MNILITGALGHIGSSILSRLNEINNIKNVFIIDDLRSNNINVLFNLRPKNKNQIYKSKFDKLSNT